MAHKHALSVAALAVALLVSLPAHAQQTVAHGTVELPLTRPGQPVAVEKVFTDGTVELRSPGVGGPDALEDLRLREQAARDARYGAIRGELQSIFDKMAADDTVTVVVHPKPPAVTHPDKHRTPVAELIAHSQSLRDLGPPVDAPGLAVRHGLVPKEPPGKADEEARDTLVVEVDRAALARLRSDKDVAVIELYRDTEPLAYPLDSYSLSAFNPPPLPSGARGGGVHAATFETGIWNDVFTCLGLDPLQVDVDDTASLHSNQMFKVLWHSAPEADHYHRDSLGYSSTSSQTWIVDHGIQTTSLSYTRGGNENNYEFLVMDDFAYRWPYPVFANPTANSGYQYEAHWQQYNGINVGNVRHMDESYFILAGCTQTRNPDPVYGSSLPGTPAGDRELPNLVAPGIRPFDSTATVNDPCIGSFQLWCGTSISAPNLNGVAADVISSDSRMVNHPEAVKLALVLTAQNVDGGYSDAAVDGRDGQGVVSAAEAVDFARNHISVRPGSQAQRGMDTGSLNAGSEGSTFDYYVRVPSAPLGSRHLRAAVVWTSNPDVSGGQNHLSDLDLSLLTSGGTLVAGSYSLDDNVEVLDVSREDLTPGALYTLRLHVVDARIPAGARTSYFYYALGWDWPKDFFFPNPVREYEVGVYTPSYCDPALTGLDESAERFCREMGHDDFVSYDIESRGGVHTWWNGSSWSISGNSNVCYVTNLRCRPPRTFYPEPTPDYQIGVYSSYYSCTYSGVVSQLDSSGNRFCQERAFTGFASYETDGPVGGVHTWWNGSSWSTSGNNDVCYMEDLSCRRTEVCFNGLDDDGDGYVDEGC